MAIRKVYAGRVYYYNPTLLDRIDARTDLKQGNQVRVVNLPGCPKANTMGHCHIESVDPDVPNNRGRFIGLVCTSSLDTPEQYRAYLQRKVQELERNRVEVL